MKVNNGKYTINESEFSTFQSSSRDIYMKEASTTFTIVISYKPTDPASTSKSETAFYLGTFLLSLSLISPQSCSPEKSSAGRVKKISGILA